jgi:carnitine O-acetyltransferase
VTARTEEPTAGTFAYELRLPRVPLPTVEESCERFLDWCGPLLTEAELAQTRDAVASFLRPDGGAHAQHAALARYDATEGVHSWLDAFWDSRYLGRRDRIALNANYFLLLTDTGQDQVRRAATLIAAAVAYKRLLDAERVPPVTRSGRPLSMEQLKYLFSTTRIPGVAQDTVRSPYTPEWPGPSREAHIVVLAAGYAYEMTVLDGNGRPYTVDQLGLGLRRVLAEVRTAPRGPSVGCLTAAPRPQWARARAALLRHPVNASTLDRIERALFCVSLEPTPPADTTDACNRLLHGDPACRWFDKSLTLIVFGDGTAGMNVEHSRLDGTTVAEVVDAWSRLPGDGAAEPPGPAGSPTVRPLRFVLDERLREEIREAGRAFAAQAADTAGVVVSLPQFGRQQARMRRVSADGFLQMAFQLAHRRARGVVGATYESVSTRAFRHGRTEAMRVVTPESVRFVSTMDDPAAGPAVRAAALRAALAAHVDRVRECQEGRAPEQHLWELELRRCRDGGRPEDAPDLYRSPGWRRLRDDYLSTSSVTCAGASFFGFGPTGPRCIGVAYAVLPDRVNLYLSAPRPIAGELRAFVDHLGPAVEEMWDLLAVDPAS